MPKVPQAVKERAVEMLNELAEHRLEVVLVPAPEPRHTEHYIRVAVDRPPQWFSAMARRYMRSSKRQPRPRPNFIKRRASLQALEAIAAGEIRTTYAQRWYREIKRLLANESETIPF